MTKSNSKAVNILFHVIGIIVAFIVMMSGIAQIIFGVHADYFSIQNFVVGSFLFLFGLILFIIELKVLPIIYHWLGLLASWIGRGVFVIFCGFLCFVGGGWWFLLPVFSITCGIVYIVLGILRVELPPPMLGEAPSNHGERV